MKKHLLFLLFYIIVNKGNSQNIENDSIIIGNLKLLINEFINDVDDVSKTYIDSSQYTLIAGIKAYHKKSLSKSVKPDSLVKLFQSQNKLNKFKIYAYLFDYLFEKGLDLNYDYYNRFVYDTKNSFYIDRFKSSEYYQKRRILYYFFDLYKNYKICTISNRDDRQLQASLIENIINYGNFKYPKSCERVLKMDNVLDRNKLENKIQKLNNNE